MDKFGHSRGHEKKAAMSTKGTVEGTGRISEAQGTPLFGPSNQPWALGDFIIIEMLGCVGKPQRLKVTRCEDPNDGVHKWRVTGPFENWVHQHHESFYGDSFFEDNQVDASGNPVFRVLLPSGNEPDKGGVENRTENNKEEITAVDKDQVMSSGVNQNEGMLAGSERLDLIFSALDTLEARNADKSDAVIVEGGEDKNQAMPTAPAMAECKANENDVEGETENSQEESSANGKDQVVSTAAAVEDKGAGVQVVKNTEKPAIVIHWGTARSVRWKIGSGKGLVPATVLSGNYNVDGNPDNAVAARYEFQNPVFPGSGLASLMSLAALYDDVASGSLLGSEYKLESPGVIACDALFQMGSCYVAGNGKPTNAAYFMGLMAFEAPRHGIPMNYAVVVAADKIDADVLPGIGGDTTNYVPAGILFLVPFQELNEEIGKATPEAKRALKRIVRDNYVFCTPPPPGETTLSIPVDKLHHMPNLATPVVIGKRLRKKPTSMTSDMGMEHEKDVKKKEQLATKAKELAHKQRMECDEARRARDAKRKRATRQRKKDPLKSNVPTRGRGRPNFPLAGSTEQRGGNGSPASNQEEGACCL